MASTAAETFHSYAPENAEPALLTSDLEECVEVQQECQNSEIPWNIPAKGAFKTLRRGSFPSSPGYSRPSALSLSNFSAQWPKALPSSQGPH